MSLSRTLTIVPALLLGLALASCDRIASAPDLDESPRSTAPAFSAGKLSDYTRIQGQIPSGVPTQLSRVIGVGGGVIDLAGYSLSVPAGAVEEPALFTISLLPTGFVEVDLTALAATPGAGRQDLGAAGFKNGKTVRATLTYAHASNVANPRKLLILRMLRDGAVEPLHSVVDVERQTVSVELEHFSRYCLASN